MMSLYFGDGNRPVSQEVLDTISEYEKNEFVISARLTKCHPYKSRYYGHFSFYGGIMKIPLEHPLMIGAYYQLRGYAKSIVADKSSGYELLYFGTITNIIPLPTFDDKRLEAPKRRHKAKTEAKQDTEQDTEQEANIKQDSEQEANKVSEE